MIHNLLFHPSGILDQSPWSIEVRNALLSFELGCVNLVSAGTNVVANEIATSVTRDFRPQSYVAYKGSAWLEACILMEATSAR